MYLQSGSASSFPFSLSIVSRYYLNLQKCFHKEKKAHLFSLPIQRSRRLHFGEKGPFFRSYLPDSELSGQTASPTLSAGIWEVTELVYKELSYSDYLDGLW